MAEAVKKFELGVMDVQWVKKALETQRFQLIRSRTKEVPGTEIHVLRGKEVDSLTRLIQTFS